MALQQRFESNSTPAPAEVPILGRAVALTPAPAGGVILGLGAEVTISGTVRLQTAADVPVSLRGLLGLIRMS